MSEQLALVVLPRAGVRLRAGTPELAVAKQHVVDDHYLHSLPMRASYWFEIDDAIVVFSLPANYRAAASLFFSGARVFEMSRLWAPDGHEPNLLTRAISSAIRALREIEPNVDGLVSYADPNAGHSGGVYRAASWTQVPTKRLSRDWTKDGRIVPRRAFSRLKTEHRPGGRLADCRCEGRTPYANWHIVEMGWTEIVREARLVFVKPVTRRARKAVRQRARQALSSARSGG